MMRRPMAFLILGLAGLLVSGILMSGCGEKIAIPEAEGVFSIDPDASRIYFTLSGERL